MIICVEYPMRQTLFCDVTRLQEQFKARLFCMLDYVTRLSEKLGFQKKKKKDFA